MTFAERVRAVAEFSGFTTRQAAFLTTVMLYAGVCLPRQYPQYAGIVLGRTTRDFFQALVAQRLATSYRTGAGALFHVHHKGLYRAIGEPDNRHRRRPTVARAVERLMVLDAIMRAPEIAWLATEREKVAHFVQRAGLAMHELPALTFGEGSSRTTRYFPEKLPIGVASEAEDIVLLYVVTDAERHDLQMFLASHRTLLQRLPRWCVRLVLPGFLGGTAQRVRRVVEEFCAPPVRSGVVDEFRWFCGARRALEGTPATPTVVDAGRYATARRAFAAPRFYAAYRAWVKEGEPALHDLLSARLSDAWQRGDARVDTCILPNQYLRLATAIGTA